ncbi:MAG: endolytic transglycosylase MltG [Candidatus Saccharimonadales bacterium]
MKRYKLASTRRHWPRRLLWVFGGLIVLLLAAIIAIRQVYDANLKPLSQNAQAKIITVEKGMAAKQIGELLHNQGVIRSAWAFSWYVQNKEVRDELQAGTYSLSPSQSVADIVGQLTHGKVTTKLVTILPGQRLDQIQQTLINDGFNESAVKASLNASLYENSAALVDKPAGASLEGYLYPDSFQKTATTSPKTIIEESLTEMQKRLTPDIRSAFAKQGLSTYQGITLASIVEQEVSNQSDRAQAAQVFLKRLSINMPLGSDVTALYGSRQAGQTGLLSYDSPYNTLLHTGLPPAPISNISESSLQAVAHPAATDWLFFVSGDNGTTYFSRNLAEHQALTQQYCHKLCGQ